MKDPIGVAFNMLKLRYVDYDNEIDRLQVLTINSKINVFINIESVFKILSTIKDLDNISRLTFDLSEIFASDLLNLAGHYKRFFSSNGLQTNIYLYYTNPRNKRYPEHRFNEDHRSYYHIKYTTNAKFADFFNKILKKGMSLAKTICEFIPGVYIIEGNNFDGSVIPYTISEMDKSRFNFMITNDISDTQYMSLDKFWVHCLQKKFENGTYLTNVSETLSFMTRKKQETLEEEIKIFSSHPFFITLLAVAGDNYKSVEPIKGIGPIGLRVMINNAIVNHLIPSDISDITPDTLSFIFPTPQRDNIIRNIECVSVKQMHKRLSDPNKESIKSSFIDRQDTNSLITMNSTQFKNHNIILENLL